MKTPPKQLVPGGHLFRTTDNEGTIDNWALDSGFHNGPKCVSCKQKFCEHCEPDVYVDICPGKGIIVLQETAPRKELTS